VTVRASLEDVIYEKPGLTAFEKEVTDTTGAKWGAISGQQQATESPFSGDISLSPGI
jgi:hypothetical protein